MVLNLVSLAPRVTYYPSFPARGMLAVTVASPPFFPTESPAMCDRHRNTNVGSEPTSDETRREFMQTAGVAAAGAVAFGTVATANAAEDKKPGEGIPTRPLGKTGVNVSILCLGGW